MHLAYFSIYRKNSFKCRNKQIGKIKNKAQNVTVKIARELRKERNIDLKLNGKIYRYTSRLYSLM